MWLNVLLVFGTWVLAAGTIYLAKKTHDMAKATQTTADATRAAAQATAEAARTTYEAQVKAIEFQKLGILADVMPSFAKENAVAAVGGSKAFIDKAKELGLSERGKA